MEKYIITFSKKMDIIGTSKADAVYQALKKLCDLNISLDDISYQVEEIPLKSED